MIVADGTGFRFCEFLIHGVVRCKGWRFGRLPSGAVEHWSVEAVYPSDQLPAPALDYSKAIEEARKDHTRYAVPYKQPQHPPLIHKSVLASWVSCAKEWLRVCVLPRMPPHPYMNARRDAHGGRMTPGYRTCHTETAFGCACWCIDALCSQSASPTGRRHDRFCIACPAHQLGKLKCRSLCCSLLSPGK